MMVYLHTSSVCKYYHTIILYNDNKNKKSLPYLDFVNCHLTSLVLGGRDFGREYWCGV